MLGNERSTLLLQMILKQKLRGQGMAFIVGGGSGIIHFTFTCLVIAISTLNCTLIDAQ